MNLIAQKLTNGTKIQLLQLLLCAMIIGLVALNYMFGMNQHELLARETTLVERLGRVSRLVVEIKNLQVDVIQVQQFLTDISATRAQDGYDDGAKVAEEHAQSFKTKVEIVTKEARELGLAEIEAAVTEVSGKFPLYYDTGKQMAERYISGGPAAGNSFMETFDATALAIGNSLGKLVSVGEAATAEATQAAANLKNESASFQKNSLVLGLIAISTGVAAVVFARVLDRQARTKQKEADDLRQKQLDDEHLRAVETSTVITILADGLERLAHGDLTCSIVEKFPADFDRLRENFNETTAKLKHALLHVREGSNKIHFGTGEIAQASDDLSRRTETQAASLEETAAAVREITAAFHESSERTQKASQEATTANREAQESSAVVEQAMHKMGRIQESSAKIVDIIGVIDDIAFQTNLLALNAGVEAARAGDSGRGFAVVAAEVRELSERSATAARGIKALLESSSMEIADGVSLVSETGKSLKAISARIASIAGTINELNTTIKSQSRGLGEVSIAVEQMDKVTQQNAAMVEEANAATRALNEQTDELARLVSVFNTSDTAVAA